MFEDLKDRLKKPPSLEVILEMLYLADQDVSISCFGDRWDVKIEDHINSHWEGSFEELNQATRYLYDYYQKNLAAKGFEPLASE